MPSLILYYDKECPICKQYVLFLKIKKSYSLILKNAREANELEAICKDSHLDINDGLILIVDEKIILQGKQALLYLKTLDSNTNIFYRIFISKALIGLVYPLLKMLRMFLLKILKRVSKIKFDS